MIKTVRRDSPPIRCDVTLVPRAVFSQAVNRLLRH